MKYVEANNIKLITSLYPFQFFSILQNESYLLQVYGIIAINIKAAII